MQTKQKDKRILFVAAIFVIILFGGIGVTVLYYNNQIANLNSQITNLNSQIVNLEKPNLITSLGIREMLNNATYNAADPNTFNHLNLGGTVTNFGLGTAYNAGLQVVALDTAGNVVVNMTVPFVAGTYGLGENMGPTGLSQLGSTEVGTINVSIYHPGVASTWTITPVWTASA